MENRKLNNSRDYTDISVEIVTADSKAKTMNPYKGLSLEQREQMLIELYAKIYLRLHGVVQESEMQITIFAGIDSRS